jgi:hypothetical protein
MVAGGGTRITPAVETAIGLFGPPAAPSKTIRHILLLSDGLSEDFAVPRLIAACSAAGVSVTTVATGPDTDVQRLGRLATQTGGRVHAGAGIARLAETFLLDIAWVRGDRLRQETRAAEWRQPEPIWRSVGPPLPQVVAFNPTRVKEGADLLWVAPGTAGTSDAAPLLAVWRRGLGKVAAMPWPVSAAPWETTALLRDLVSVLEWLHTPQVPTDWSVRLLERDGSWWVRAEERAERIGKASSPFDALRATPSMVEGSPLVATVFGAGGSKEERRSLEAVGPGIYEARIGPRGGPVAMVVVRREDHTAAQTVSVPEAPPREFERFGVDRAALERIVRAGGGMIHTDPETLAEAVRNFETRDFLPVGV